jgi:hypothetical protein
VKTSEGLYILAVTANFSVVIEIPVRGAHRSWANTGMIDPRIDESAGSSNEQDLFGLVDPDRKRSNYAGMVERAGFTWVGRSWRSRAPVRIESGIDGESCSILDPRWFW